MRFPEEGKKLAAPWRGLRGRHLAAKVRARGRKVAPVVGRGVLALMALAKWAITLFGYGIAFALHARRPEKGSVDCRLRHQNVTRSAICGDYSEALHII